MKVNKELRDTYFEIVDTQIKNNDPPETKKTMQRLLAEGYTDFEAHQLIGQCIAIEVYDILKNNREFDLKKYISHLKNLPEKPYDD